jgi:hypothetical protein
VYFERSRACLAGSDRIKADNVFRIVPLRSAYQQMVYRNFELGNIHVTMEHEIIRLSINDAFKDKPYLE